MLTRRGAFKPIAALACGLPRSGYSPAACKSIFSADLPVDKPEVLKQGRPFQLSIQVSAPDRPLLSKMSGTARQDILRDIRGAYESLLCRSVNDVTAPGGLIGQAAVHWRNCSEDIGVDVHVSRLFLPWHRGYLYFHERALQHRLGSRFRLPVWDWENQDDVPPIYAEWADTMHASYFHKNLGGSINKTVLQSWLSPYPNPQCFIGGIDKQGFASSGTPHSWPHSWLGGFMRNFKYAGADPLFYGHHANVDRYWDFWQHHYKCDDSWNHEGFTFFDEHGKPVSITVGQLLRIRDLNYSYPAAHAPDPSLFGFSTPVNPGRPFPGGYQFDLVKIRKLLDTASTLFRNAIGDPVGSTKAVLRAAVKEAQTIDIPIRVFGSAPDAVSGTSYSLIARRIFSFTDDNITFGRFGLIQSGHNHLLPTSSLVNSVLNFDNLQQISRWGGLVSFALRADSPDAKEPDHPFGVSEIQFLLPGVL